MNIYNGMTDAELEDSEHFERAHRDVGCVKSVKWVCSHGSGIGCSVYVVCPDCGQTQDITDYDSW